MSDAKPVVVRFELEWSDGKIERLRAMDAARHYGALVAACAFARSEGRHLDLADMPWEEDRAAPVSEEAGSEGRCPKCGGPGGYVEVDGLSVPRCCAPRAPAPPPSTGDEARHLLAEVVRLMPWHISGQPGQGPGHGHAAPGIWDDDHPPGKRGTPCEWCALWVRIRALLAAAPSPRAQTGTGPSEAQLAGWERMIENTPRNWRVDTDVEGEERDVVATCPDGETQVVIAECFTDDEAHLIAAARNALPVLIAEVRRLRSSALRWEEREPRRRRIAFMRLIDEAERIVFAEEDEGRKLPHLSFAIGEAKAALSSPATNPDKETDR